MSTGTATDLAAWVGNTEVRTAVVPAGLDAELRGTLGLPTGGALLAGLHWLIFDHFAPVAATGPDGHPRRGGFLPPVAAPRRMWAGGRLTFLNALEEGDVLTRRSEILSVSTKQGSAGSLTFVTVRHEVDGTRGRLIQEEQDLGYMDIAPAAPRQRAEIDATPQRAATVEPDEVMLFRYSALTHNSHRIHYDADYARSVELYPSLVVHGPLTATLLMWWATAGAKGGRLASFSFRGRSPLYVHDSIQLEADTTDVGGAGGVEVSLAARNPLGGIGMTATAVVTR